MFLNRSTRGSGDPTLIPGIPHGWGHSANQRTRSQGPSAGQQDRNHHLCILCVDAWTNCCDTAAEDTISQREAVAVLTFTVPRLPEVLDGRSLSSSDLHDLRENIRLVYRMAAHNGKQMLVPATTRDTMIYFRMGCPWSFALVHHGNL
ncbi:hypothetical protein BDM02DRAFT_3002815 [Thelephora ganbajun]|uniref:Uncharacterized protein n=1 Tax=Thelephora ganbajun TaxID=370292 RepID=A0ACB6ZAC1_THEGA|nr:hypothetical protein BDM02DRAFT_3002815 [Thelephora ganbajun]